VDALQTQLRGHQSAIYALAFSPDRSLLASGDFDGSIRLWNLKTGQLQSVLREASSYDYSVWALAFSPDGAVLASGDVTGLCIWDSETSTERFAHKLGEIASLAWKPNGKVLACGTDVITLCNGQTGEILRILKGHTDYVTAVAWNPSGTLLATGSEEEDGSIRIWDIESGEQVAILEYAHNKLGGIAFYSDDKLFYTKGYGTLFQWEIKSGRTLKLFDSDNTMHETGFSQDGRLVAYGTRGHGNTGQIYHINLSVVAEDKAPTVLCPDGDEIMCIVFNSDNTMLAISDGADIIRVWNVRQLLR
jgi:WD40 repeat protein